MRVSGRGSKQAVGGGKLVVGRRIDGGFIGWSSSRWRLYTRGKLGQPTAGAPLRRSWSLPTRGQAAGQDAKEV